MGEDEETKVFGAGTKMQSYNMKLRLLPLTPLQRESLHGNVKGTKIAAITGKHTPTRPPRKTEFQSLKTESRSFTAPENAPRPGAIVQKQLPLKPKRNMNISGRGLPTANH